MNCVHPARTQLDDYVDGRLESNEHKAVRRHLEDCATCREVVEETEGLVEALRQLPVPPPTPDFAARALRRAAASPRRRAAFGKWPTGRWGFAAGFGSAMAAGLALWVIAGLWTGPTGQTPLNGPATAQSVGGVELALQKVRPVELAFNAPADIHDVTFTLELPPGVQLQGHPGERTIVWRNKLYKGRNVLHLRLIARHGSGGDLVARIQHSDKVKAFRLHLGIKAPQAQDTPTLGLQLG